MVTGIIQAVIQVHIPTIDVLTASIPTFVFSTIFFIMGVNMFLQRTW